MKSEIKIVVPAKVDPKTAAAAKRKAAKKKTTISSVINNLLKAWIVTMIILFLSSCATQNGCQQNRNFIGYHSK